MSKLCACGCGQEIVFKKHHKWFPPKYINGHNSCKQRPFGSTLYEFPKKLIQHHIKYKEIHGEDVIVWLTYSEHRALHNKLRNEKKCNILPEKLNKISQKAHQRTNRRKKSVKLYRDKHIKQIIFEDCIGKNVEIMEEIRYIDTTGSISYFSHFKSYNGFRLYIINEVT